MPFKNIKDINHLLKIASTYVGYRSESYGEMHSVRDLKKVVEHEQLELGNSDISDTLENTGMITNPRETFKYIDEIYDNGYTECIWLCQSAEDLKNEYNAEPESTYTIEDPIIISDLEKSGQLVAYKPENMSWKDYSNEF
jgi:hypothetical protein